MKLLCFCIFDRVHANYWEIMSDSRWVSRFPREGIHAVSQGDPPIFEEQYDTRALVRFWIPVDFNHMPLIWMLRKNPKTLGIHSRRLGVFVWTVRTTVIQIRALQSTRRFPFLSLLPASTFCLPPVLDGCASEVFEGVSILMTTFAQASSKSWCRPTL